MKKYISKFHYLTVDTILRTHIEQAALACEAGANWVQYRCFSKTDEEMISDLLRIGQICDEWGSTLIITDHYHLLDEADIQGVHVEDMNADFGAVRKKIGSEATLGASANTLNDILRIHASGVVDYTGCGPFSLTRTKPNSYPVLGVEGYKTLIAEMHRQAIDIPLVAIGGITTADVDPLMGIGIHGIAVSAAVNEAADPASALKEIYREIY